MSVSLDKEFKDAYHKASTTNVPLAPDVMLRLYAYYKQATLDYSHQFIHHDMDLVRAFKFNAWKQVAYLTQEDAKILYIDLVKSLNL